MSEQGLIQAERRVREMNRVTRQYTEQGNRFMQQLQQMQNMRNNQTRFEQVVPNNNTYNHNNGINGINSTGGTIGAQSPKNPQRQNGGQRQQNMRSPHNAQAAQSAQSAQSAQAVQTAQNFQGQQTVRFETAAHNSSGRNYPAGNAPMWNPSSGNSMAGMLSFLSDMNLDGEKLMIILIMYLLIKEKADIKLILALGYLLF